MLRLRDGLIALALLSPNILHAQSNCADRGSLVFAGEGDLDGSDDPRGRADLHHGVGDELARSGRGQASERHSGLDPLPG